MQARRVNCKDCDQLAREGEFGGFCNRTQRIVYNNEYCEILEYSTRWGAILGFIWESLKYRLRRK